MFLLLSSTESLSWIIKAFWNLEEEISREVFWDYLDEGNIDYLFEVRIDF